MGCMCGDVILRLGAKECCSFPNAQRTNQVVLGVAVNEEVIRPHSGLMKRLLSPEDVVKFARAVLAMMVGSDILRSVILAPLLMNVVHVVVMKSVFGGGGGEEGESFTGKRARAGDGLTAAGWGELHLSGC